MTPSADSIRLELHIGPLTATECAALLEADAARTSIALSWLAQQGDVEVFGVQEKQFKIAEQSGNSQKIYKLTAKGMEKVMAKRPQRVLTMSAAVIDMHPFVVFVPHEQMDGSGDQVIDTLIGRFASLYCASQTALWHGGGAIVTNEKTGYRYTKREMMAAPLSSVPGRRVA